MNPRLVLVCIIFLLLSNCENDTVIPEVYRIQSITTYYNGELFGSQEFQYANNRLARLLQYDPNGGLNQYDQWQISYNGNIIVKEYFTTRYSGHIPEKSYQKEREELHLKGNRVVQKLQYSKLTSLSIDLSLLGKTIYEYSNERLSLLTNTYNESNEFIYSGDSLITINLIKDNIMHPYGSLHYQNGLLSEVILIYPEDHPVHDSIHISYTYNSYNQLIETIQADNSGLATVRFEYNDNGLLSRQVVTGAYPEDVEYVYEYEVGIGNTPLIWHDPEEFIFLWPYKKTLIPTNKL